MKNSTELLKELIVNHCLRVWDQNSSSDVRPFLHGLPEGAARRLFDLLTKNGTTNLDIGNGRPSLPVILIDTKGHTAGKGSAILSGVTNWDYAISVRNSVGSFVSIATPSASMTEQQSMSNTTESFDFGPGRRGEPLWDKAPWSYVLDAVERSLEFEDRQRGSLVPLLRTSWALATEDSAIDRVANVWAIIDGWLGLQASAKLELLRSAGFPAPQSRDISLAENTKAAQLIERLAKRAGQEKSFTTFEESLLEAASKLPPLGVSEIEMAICEFVHELKQGFAVTISEFATSPVRSFAEAARSAGWWEVLTTETWEKLLQPVAKGPVAVTLSVVNKINEVSEDGFPTIVADEVELECHVEGDGSYQLSVARSVGRGRPTSLDVELDNLFVDDDLPAHWSELVYTAKITDGSITKQDKQFVISLASFEPGLICHVEGMQMRKIQRAGAGHCAQEATLDGSGYKDIVVYVSDEDSQICIVSSPYSGDEPSAEALLPVEHEWQSVVANRATRRGFRLEEDTYLRIWKKCPHASSEPTIALDLVLTIPPEEYSSGGLPCLVSSLVAVHQGSIKKVDKAAIIPPCDEVEKLEQQLLERSTCGSILGCWREPGELSDRQAWAIEEGRLGLATPGLLRPVERSVPTQFIDARRVVLEEIKRQRRPLRQVDFTSGDMVAASDKYLVAYHAWLQEDPAAASWLELIACYAGPAGSLAHVSGGTEPHALLMSPLHPLKIAFNAKCQALLREGSLKDLCPLAGYLDPHAIPGILELQLVSDSDEKSVPRVFLNAGSTDPFWTIFWSGEVIARERDRVLLGVLERLRLLRPGLSGGFSESLVRQAMREVEELTPTRSVFQIGLQGHPLASATCGKAILDWCADRATSTRRFAVYDRRQNPSAPTDQALAYVAGEKPDAVRWFEQDQATSPLDILIVDDLETKDWSIIDRERYDAVVGPNGLFRFQTRADHSNGLIVQVAYAANPNETAYEQSCELKVTALLEGAPLSSGKAHYRFSPNTQEIYSGLGMADFVAVTSRDVDPACFIHGAGLEGGVLWDYELPTLTGMTSSSVGYYLVAKPREAMIAAIESAVSLLIEDTAEAKELTARLGQEIAARGMPILRRLGGGGSQARGELGVLLTLRALQGKIAEVDSPSCLPLYSDDEVNLLIAVDPYWEVFEQARKALDAGSTFERPDILVFSIIPGSETLRTCLRITPLEVKFRSHKMSPPELGKALGQASNLGHLLEKIWGQNPPSTLWSLAGRNLLASCIEHGFRVGATRNAHGLQATRWAKLQARVILDVMSGDADVDINATGRLIAFDKRDETKTFSLSQASETDTMTVGIADAIELLRDTVDETSPVFDAVQKLAFRCRKKGGLAPRSSKDPKPVPSHYTDLSVAPLANTSHEDSRSDTRAMEAPEAEEVRIEVEGDDLQLANEATNNGAVEESASQAAGLITPESRQRVERAFDGFVGNDNAVRTIQRDLLFASLQNPPSLSETYLLSGPPSTGKTELSRRIAKALGLPFVALDGKAVDSRDKLFTYIRSKLQESGEDVVDEGTDAGRPVRRYPPFVVLIDEVHLVKRSVQEAMLTLLEANDRTVTLTDEYALVDTATFLFATTRPSDLDGAFKTRCREIALQPYTVAEVAQMLLREAENRDLFRDDEDKSDILTAVAAVGRSIPRIALQVLAELEREMVVSHSPGRPSVSHLQEVMKSRGVDEIGVTRRDLDVLEFLEKQDGPIGEDRMLSMLHTVDRDTVLGEIDPFLQKLGYVAHDRTGRVITRRGRDYLFERRMRDQELR